MDLKAVHVNELRSGVRAVAVLVAVVHRKTNAARRSESRCRARGISFSAALAMIASLPLSDAEKADAVRRLMAERDGSQR